MTEYSLETKAGVLADYSLGMAKAGIARKWGVPRTTVIDWIRDSDAPAPTVTDTLQREELGRLVYDYLSSALRALIAQNELATDPAYLQREGTNFAAVYGTVHAGFMAVAQAVEEGADSEGLPLIPGGAGA
jgi:hypothetical protein